jgi:hypothetical protein
MVLWPNIEDHSQIVRFVSSFIACGFEGISRAVRLMGVVLVSYAVFRHEIYGISLRIRILKGVL